MTGLLDLRSRVSTSVRLYADDSKWRALTKIEDALEIVGNDFEELFPQISKQISNIDTVLARSLGTYGLICALERNAIAPKQIVWQCPSLMVNLLMAVRLALKREYLAVQIVAVGGRQIIGCRTTRRSKWLK